MCSLKRTSIIKLQSVSWEGDYRKDFLEYTVTVSDVATAVDIQELQGIMSRKRIGRKRGPLGDRISKLLVYGGQIMPETKIKIGGGVMQSLKDFKTAERRK